MKLRGCFESDRIDQWKVVVPSTVTSVPLFIAGSNSERRNPNCGGPPPGTKIDSSLDALLGVRLESLNDFTDVMLISRGFVCTSASN